MSRCFSRFCLVVLVALLFPPGPAGAEEGGAQPLPLREVALFSSGVGYFLRSGQWSVL